jgi:hypothetical protein
MQQKTTTPPSSSSQLWERVETCVREPVQPYIHALWAEESTELWGRSTSARRASVATPPGRRTGSGQPRGRSFPSGTITRRRPRVRGLGARWVSRVVPL